MPEISKRPLRVFLCHAHNDRNTVKALYDHLVKDGVDAWLDKEKLLPGANWELEIRKAVRESDVVVVCLSKQFNQAGFRQREVRWALDTAMEQPEGTIFIIPARLEECEECDVPESLLKWHWVDLFEKDGYETLRRALRERGKEIGAVLQPAKNIFSLKTRPKQKLPVMKGEGKPSTQSRKKTSKNAKLSPTITAALITTIGVIVVGLLGFEPLVEWVERTPIPTKMSTFTATFPTLTTIPSITSTATEIITSSATPYLAEIIDPKGVKMIIIPEGIFTMGNNLGLQGEGPAHQVDLDTFYIDIYEVTNASYAECVTAAECTKKPGSLASYNNPLFANHPVITVSWDMAAAYCKWRGARLPTEAEWEKAARGTDSRTYPWGEGINCIRANYYKCINQSLPTNDDQTTVVGSYADGRSPYGIYDMAGNAWEWVQDWYSTGYYSELSPQAKNPFGPALDLGWGHVVRGGSWLSGPSGLQTTYRGNFAQVSYASIGFRCAKDAISGYVPISTAESINTSTPTKKATPLPTWTPTFPPPPETVKITDPINGTELPCPTGQGCSISVSVSWDNPVSSRVCVYVHPKEMSGQDYYLQFVATSGTAWIGVSQAARTPFDIVAIATSASCPIQTPQLPTPNAIDSIEIMRINQ